MLRTSVAFLFLLGVQAAYYCRCSLSARVDKRGKWPRRMFQGRVDRWHQERNGKWAKGTKSINQAWGRDSFEKSRLSANRVSLRDGISSWYLPLPAGGFVCQFRTAAILRIGMLFQFLHRSWTFPQDFFILCVKSTWSSTLPLFGQLSAAPFSTFMVSASSCAILFLMSRAAFWLPQASFNQCFCSSVMISSLRHSSTKGDPTNSISGCVAWCSPEMIWSSADIST